MDLEEKYKKETGFDVGKIHTTGTTYSSCDYVEWLEKQISTNEKPTPYKWIKEEKFQIPAGASYREPKVSLFQCANWISEYVKKYC